MELIPNAFDEQFLIALGPQIGNQKFCSGNNSFRILGRKYQFKKSYGIFHFIEYSRSKSNI